MSYVLYTLGSYKSAVLSDIEGTLGRKLTRTEINALHELGEIQADGRYITREVKITRVYVRKNRVKDKQYTEVVFRHWLGRTVALCPERGRGSDHMTPMYDGEWSWVNHSEVMRGSVSADPVEELLKGVRDRFGESRVAERCRARYDVGHLGKDRMEEERRSEPVDLDAPRGW